MTNEAPLDRNHQAENEKRAHENQVSRSQKRFQTRTRFDKVLIRALDVRSLCVVEHVAME